MAPRSRGQAKSVAIFKPHGAHLAIILCLHLINHASAATFPGDIAALRALQQSVGNPASLSSWQTGDPCSLSWRGISGCIADDTGYDRVALLSMFQMDLQGVMPAELGQLSRLSVLDLSLNPGLHGPIPPALGNLSSLTQLNLQRCTLQGQIPGELGKLSTLQFLTLNDNQLTGSLPKELGGLASLIFFDVTNNQLSGPLPMLPMGLGQLSEVRHFHLGSNLFSGPVPGEFGVLQKAIHLLLYNNSFSGPLPPGIGNMSGLQVLALDHNPEVIGGIPLEYNKLSLLDSLSMADCNMSGTVPDLFGMPGLWNLNLRGNSFSGSLPPTFGTSLTNLQAIDISNNNFTGTLDKNLLSLRFLNSFAAGNNKLTGAVPDFSGTSNLTELFLPGNGLSGPVPADVLSDPHLTLVLSGNPLCQGVPLQSKLGVDCQVINDEAVLGRYMADPFCPNTTCSGNQTPSSAIFFGAAQKCTCRTPLTMVLMLMAPPFAIFTNGLAQELQRELYAELTPFMNISINQVHIVSANETDTRQQLVKVQFFPPEAQAAWDPQWDQFVAGYVANHNTDLGPEFRPYTVTSMQLATTYGSGKKGGLSTGALVGIIVGTVVGVLQIALLIALLAWWRIRASHQRELKKRGAYNSWLTGEEGDDDLKDLKVHGVQYISLADLERATDNFSNILGDGSYGTVYKGTLKSGVEVAVKRARPGSQQCNRSFRTEIENLSGVRHRNLVVLLGFCKEHGEQLLVYEYMPRGNLYEQLHGKGEGWQPLDWPQRVEIALGAARGIAYLHKEINPPIVHRDIKSSNILLDERLHAKVADFGLSKIGPEDDKAADAKPTNVKGTLGYLDPEYFMSDRLTEKSDVYSYGVVLLELLTARRPIENYEHIVRKVIMTIINHGALLEAIVDPKLRAGSRRGMEMMLDLGIRCVKNRSEHRPSMTEVVQNLETMKECCNESDFAHNGDGPFSASTSFGTAEASTLSLPLGIGGAQVDDEIDETPSHLTSTESSSGSEERRMSAILPR